MSLLNLDRGIEIGRYYGAPIRLHLYFFVLALIFTRPWWVSYGGPNFGLAGIMTAILLLSILLHELAHGEVARHYGVASHSIGIGLYGGVIFFEEAPRGVGPACAISLAGPLANLVLGGIAFGLLVILVPLIVPAPPMVEIGGQLFRASPPTLLERAVRAGAYINLGLCVVNLLPAFPLDGGRILYELVAQRRGHGIAMRVVGLSGLVFAVAGTVLVVTMAFAGLPILAPPEFRMNWRAFQAGRPGHAQDDFDPFMDPETEPGQAVGSR